MGYGSGRMEQRLVIDLEEMPEEGVRMEGELDGGIFGIDCDDVRSAGPVHYELAAEPCDTELLVRVTVRAPFVMRCVRCLREFEYVAETEVPELSVDMRGRSSVDVTDEVREEVLLDLPNYPKCELLGEKCEINDVVAQFRLDKDPHSGVDSSTASGESVWDALDEFPEK